MLGDLFGMIQKVTDYRKKQKAAKKNCATFAQNSLFLRFR